jgi:1-acyl-sn-glycerol-3-phosphate acyltransferase
LPSPAPDPSSLRSAWFLALARRYVRRRIARGLDGLYVAGLDAARDAARRGPVILAANHVGWWDSFLVIALDEALGTEGYALMDAESVRRLPFFARLGALPLDRSGGARSRAGLRAGAGRLDRPGRALWVFPQGRHRPAHLRPLGFEPGIRLLARWVPDAAVVPISIQYAWGDQPGPAAYARLGAPVAASGLDLNALEAEIVEGLARIDGAVDRGEAGFIPLVAGRTASPEGGLGARLLGGREAARG